MSHIYNSIVIGLGAMGSATLYQLAQRGQHVLGIDQFQPPHKHGSSHGESRIIRQAIGEGEAYIPLVLRAYELWRALEAATQTQLLGLNGGLLVGVPGELGHCHGREDFLDYTISVAQRHAIEHTVLEAAALRRRYPQLKLQGNEVGYYEPEGGFLRPERCIEAQLMLAQHHGATMRTHEKVLGFEVQADGTVIVRTSAHTYQAEQVIVTAGAWVGELLGPAYQALFTVYPQMFYWFEADDPAHFQPETFPFLIWLSDSPEELFYAIPPMDGTTAVKVGTEQFVTTANPNEPLTSPTPAEIEAFYEQRLKPRLLGLNGRCLKTEACLYTQTPDAGFVIDRHPEFEQLWVVSPCSGHGFKHSAAIGEAVAELVTTGQSRLDLSPFSLERLLGVG